LNSAWITNQPRFTAMRFDIGTKHNVVVTAPGEALLELGWWIRNGINLQFFFPLYVPRSSFSLSHNSFKQIHWILDLIQLYYLVIVCTREAE
jgi:hypothetical protein